MVPQAPGAPGTREFTAPKPRVWGDLVHGSWNRCPAGSCGLWDGLLSSPYLLRRRPAASPLDGSLPQDRADCLVLSTGYPST